ncbi:MAG: sensor histidine kinase [Bilifractor sp.]|jgi:two-component system sensor histidine kinase YesM
MTGTAKKKKMHTIGEKLIVTYSIATAFIFIVNALLFMTINQATDRINEVYSSNVKINTLTEDIDNLQTALSDYLGTGSSSDLSAYYAAENTYSDALAGLTISGADEKVNGMIDDIAGLTDSYLDVCHDALSNARGGNVEEYAANYDTANEIYGFLKSSLYTLNGLQLNSNSESYTSLQHTLSALEVFSMLILIAVLISELVFTLFLTRSLTAPLETLSREANEISAGNFDVPAIPVTGNDEVSVVSTAFNEMVSSIRGYIVQLKTSMEHENELRENELLMDAELKDAELKYLQAQINPHFLFNTLNAGAQLALLEQADTTYRYLQNAASFFRSKTNREKQVTTLADEISLVDNYIYIINVRFSGSIAYEKMIDDDLTNVSMPSMILQPIVENAINHGFRDLTRPKKVILSVYGLGNSTAISIRDNGHGMTQEQIRQILTGNVPVRAKGDETNGVGIGNVVNRLQLFYNTEDVIDITSSGPEEGTEVILYIPKP